MCVPISFGNEDKNPRSGRGCPPGDLPMESATDGTAAKTYHELAATKIHDCADLNAHGIEAMFCASDREAYPFKPPRCCPKTYTRKSHAISTRIPAITSAHW